MDFFKLEKLAEENKIEFQNVIFENYRKFGLEEAMILLKKSGICINPYGTGKPKDKVLFNEIVRTLNRDQPDSKQLQNFENEVNIINNLYKKFTLKYMNRIEASIPSGIHVSAYLIALEIFLTEFQQKMVNDLYQGKVNGLNNSSSDFYENIVQNTGLVLKYFIYKQHPFKGISERISKENILAAGEHFNSSQIRCSLDTMMELWNYFESEIREISVEQYLIKAVGNRALGKHISHMSFMDIRNAKMSRHGYEEFLFETVYTKTKVLPPFNYISSNERTACEFIEEYFSITDLNTEFNGILLAELLRAYSIVAIESEKFLRNRKVINFNFKEIALNDVCIAKSKYKWINKFVDVGIRRNKAETILNLMTFDSTSNDIFDCPFIKMGDDYVIIPSATYITDSSRAILLNLNSRKINVSIKGDEFEKLIRQSVINSKLRCIHLEKKDYECDAVFAIENDLFFVESKNLNHPTSYREYARNLDEIHEASTQLERIVEYYTATSNIDEIKNKLGIEQVDSVTKIVVTNSSQGDKIKINGTYVIDDTCFIGYFERRPPQIVEVEGEIVVTTPLFKEYYQGKISREQFLKLIEKSPIVEQNKRRVGYHTFDYSEQLGVKFNDYFVKVNTYVLPELLSEEELDELNRIYEL